MFERAIVTRQAHADIPEGLYEEYGRDTYENGCIETHSYPLDYEAGDDLAIPRGTSYRLRPKDETRLHIMHSIMHSRSAGTVPDRGLLSQNALFKPSVREIPTPAPALAVKMATCFRYSPGTSSDQSSLR